MAQQRFQDTTDVDDRFGLRSFLRRMHLWLNNLKLAEDPQERSERQDNGPEARNEVDLADAQADVELLVSKFEMGEWFDELQHRRRDKTLQSPWAGNLVDLPEENCETHTLREVEFAEDSSGIQLPLRMLKDGRGKSFECTPTLPCLAKQYSDKEAWKMFRFDGYVLVFRRSLFCI